MDTRIIRGFDLTEKIKALCAGDNVFVVSDSNVALTYGSLWEGARHYIIPAGEDSKNLETYGRIGQAMLASGCNRTTTVIAIGGGVVGDLAGFVAATYMRGIRWINVPTTLLSQVDSSVGGKTAVDLGDYKNIMGAFHLPAEVYISTHFLYTLNEREWICGVGEVVKTAFLCERVHEIVSEGLGRLMDRDEKVIASTVKECIDYKHGVVAADLLETGLRKCLNLGHTIGHGIETVDRHQRSHGEYVLIGLAIEAFILGDRIKPELRAEIAETVDSLGISFPDFAPESVARACMKDKKNGGGKISLMLPDLENTRELRLSFEEVLRGLMLWKLSR